jgi:glycosyltransferase involved in cell wall biosynthesis
VGKTLRGGVRRSHRPSSSLPLAQGGLGIAAARTLTPPVSVSVICPTRNRPERHPGLYDVFQKQDYPDADLWVLDDSETPSSYLHYIAARDLRVHYVHSAFPLTIGAARNEMLRRCSGAVVAHFDDDDWYAPTYLSSMVKRLLDTDSDLVKLAAWTDRSDIDNTRFVYDARRKSDNNLWGWGFSYVYRRHVATRVSFHEQRVRGGGNVCEDYPFVLGLRAAGMKTTLVDGHATLAEHVWHGDNNTGWHVDG